MVYIFMSDDEGEKKEKRVGGVKSRCQRLEYPQ